MQNIAIQQPSHQERSNWQQSDKQPLNQTVKKQLLYTEERLQVAREEIAYLKAYAHLDTSFDEQSSSTIKSVAAQVNIIDDTHPTSAVQEETINTVAEKIEIIG